MREYICDPAGGGGGVETKLFQSPQENFSIKKFVFWAIPIIWWCGYAYSVIHVKCCVCVCVCVKEMMVQEIHLLLIFAVQQNLQ